MEGAQHPDRDAQFAYLNDLATSFLAAGQPVVRVDTTTREQVGNFAGQGRQWQRVGEPVRVHDHDFPGLGVGTAIPYGVYDLVANTAMVTVGTDHDTAALAVQSIRRWWAAMGSLAYPDATRLMITADAGGSNDHRRRTWKGELSRLASKLVV